MGRGFDSLQGIQLYPGGGVLITIPMPDPVGSGQQLSRSCCQPLQGTEGLVPPLADPGEGGSRSEDVGAILRCGRAGDTIFRFGYLGGTPLHVADPGGVPPKGGAEDHGEAPKETSIWGMGIPPDSGGTKGSGAQGFGDVNPMEAEHGVTVHGHLAHHGNLHEREEAPGARIAKLWWDQDGMPLEGKRGYRDRETDI